MGERSEYIRPLDFCYTEAAQRVAVLRVTAAIGKEQIPIGCGENGRGYGIGWRNFTSVPGSNSGR